MDQSELYGRVIKVNQAKPQKAAGEKLGSKTAIWEQVRSIPHASGVALRLLSETISHVANHETALFHRRTTPPSTMLAKRIGWLLRRMGRLLRIRCRGLRGLIRLVRSWLDDDGFEVLFVVRCLFVL
jgi:hypothetical protein